jgi:hypothetical protein
MDGCGLKSSGLVYGPMANSCEHDDEPFGFFNIFGFS